jgi:hypothetical protein
MLRNYFKIAWRTLRRHKMDAAINVVGLALGIACCVLLGLYVRSEWTYDQFHEKADRIVRVNRVSPTPEGGRSVDASTPAPLASALVQTFPEVETAVRLNTLSLRLCGLSAYLKSQERQTSKRRQGANHSDHEIDPAIHSPGHAMARQVQFSPKELYQLDRRPDGGTRETPNYPSFRLGLGPWHAEYRRPLLNQYLRNEAYEREENTDLANKPLLGLSHST